MTPLQMHIGVFFMQHMFTCLLLLLCFSLFVTRGILTHHAQISQLLKTDTGFDRRWRRGPCERCRALRSLRSVHIETTNNDNNRYMLDTPNINRMCTSKSLCRCHKLQRLKIRP